MFGFLKSLFSEKLPTEDELWGSYMQELDKQGNELTRKTILRPPPSTGISASDEYTRKWNEINRRGYEKAREKYERLLARQKLLE